MFKNYKLPFAWWILPIPILILVAILQIALSFTQVDFTIWQHLTNFVLPKAFVNTVFTLFLVSIGCLFIGFSLAWLVSVYNFWGQKWLKKALFLPLAIPSYIMALVYISVLDYSGFLQSFLRRLFNTKDIFWDIRSSWGLVMILTLSLYPYVYWLSRNALDSQGQALEYAARVLSARFWRNFLKVSLPLCFPYVLAGVYLVAMETLSDFGAFSAFGVDNFSTVIYKAWFGLMDYQLALQLCGIMLILVLALSLLLNRKINKMPTLKIKEPRQLIKLYGWKNWLVSGYVFFIFSIAFILPVLVLIFWALQSLDIHLDASYFMLARNSILLSGITAFVICCLGIILAVAHRLKNSFWTNSFIQVAIIGYALPSIVLAVSIYVPFRSFDFWLASLVGKQTLLAGTWISVILILSQRFLNPAYQIFNSSLKQITPDHDLAAACCGASRIRTFFVVHLSSIKKVWWSGFLLVFIDVCKELPITLIARPFNQNTLSVKIFQMTSSGLFDRAALPSLFIIFICSVAVFIISSKNQ